MSETTAIVFFDQARMMLEKASPLIRSKISAIRPKPSASMPNSKKTAARCRSAVPKSRYEPSGGQGSCSKEKERTPRQGQNN